MSSIESDLKRLAKDKALGQGYIFHGSDVQGQFKTAQQLANFLETGKWSEPEGVLSDALFIDGTKQDLGVDVAREFSNFLYKFPVASHYRTLVVNGAIDLTPQAQNALLKIAEEPPSHGLIILVVNELTVLLPPLLSRFQKIFFPTSARRGETGGASDGKEVFTPAQQEAKEFVQKFLAGNPKTRSDIVKALVTNEKDIDEKSEKVVDHFTRFLIEELYKKPEANWRALKHLLARQQAMGDYSTNKRLQLESVIPFIS
jgi:DNA polymerase III delta prime subunit